MPRSGVTKLRISPQCEAGIRYAADGRQVDYHQQCEGTEGRHLGRRFKCQCWCHKTVRQDVSR